MIYKNVNIKHISVSPRCIKGAERNAASNGNRKDERVFTRLRAPALCGRINTGCLQGKELDGVGGGGTACAGMGSRFIKWYTVEKKKKKLTFEEYVNLEKQNVDWWFPGSWVVGRNYEVFFSE